MSTTTAHPPGTFVYADPGKQHRVKGASGDCTVRALVIAAGLQYDAAYNLLADAQRRHRTPAFDLPHFLKVEPDTFGVVQQFDLPAKRGERRMTPMAFAKKYPEGNFILQVANHVTAIEDGVLYDAWDCGRKCAYAAWKIDPKAIRQVKEISPEPITDVSAQDTQKIDEPIDIGVDAESLPALAKQINRAHQHATAAAQSAIEHARRCGELLIAAKKKIGHGGFLKWVAENCHVGERQARRYMILVRGWQHIADKTDAMSDLPVAAAMKLICLARQQAKYVPLTEELAKQINAEPRESTTNIDSDNGGDCPRGGDHELKTDDGESFCQKCFEPFGQQEHARDHHDNRGDDHCADDDIADKWELDLASADAELTATADDSTFSYVASIPLVFRVFDLASMVQICREKLTREQMEYVKYAYGILELMTSDIRPGVVNRDVNRRERIRAALLELAWALDTETAS